MNRPTVEAGTNVWALFAAGLYASRIRSKPRHEGITMVIDRGLGLAATEDLLCMAGDQLDHIKLGFGTSVLVDEVVLRRKIELVRGFDVDIYPGGTLAEVALQLSAFPQYVKQAAAFGFSAIEISDGAIHMPRQIREDAIRRVQDAGLKVITEVGKKDCTVTVSVSSLCDQISADLAAGAGKVIVEARESGVGVGIFDKQGVMKTDMTIEILRSLDGKPADVIWEAPQNKQQATLISMCGPNVNLGNVQPYDVLGLEALRRGLRFETFRQFIPQPGPQ